MVEIQYIVHPPLLRDVLAYGISRYDTGMVVSAFCFLWLWAYIVGISLAV